MFKVTWAKPVDVSGGRVCVHGRVDVAGGRACTRPRGPLRAYARLYTVAWAFQTNPRVRISRHTAWCVHISDGHVARRFVTHDFGRDARADCAWANVMDDWVIFDRIIQTVACN